ncbi:MAG: zinc ribbon domain-containing protein [Lachnospiraceae bacterium]|nr:zinc ribbon domain-containing protein [Lachnospiraceae bacterium]
MAWFKSDSNQQESDRDKAQSLDLFEITPPNTEEKRLNAKLDQLNSELDSCYADIGREYYEENSDQPQNETLSPLFQNVVDKKEEIQSCTDQIRELKGITSCEHCGADILVTDVFCSSCGERVRSEVTIASSGGKCPNCGHTVTPEQKFCSICGAKVNMEEPVSEDEQTEEELVVEEVEVEELEEEEPVVEEPDAEEPEEWGAEPEGVRLCPNCGQELLEGMQFCVFCGTSIS